jgi:acetolactate synthase-1/2/3 large subunit
MPGVADDVVSRLRAAGVRMIFGLPGGGGNLDIVDAAARADLPFVLTATETGSAIAALAQAEVTRAPGACITTLGPGAASVVNGVACAYLDRAPIVVVTDSHPSDAAAFAHQRLDQRALLAPVTKWSGTLGQDDAAATLDAGFAPLAELPPGPVHFDWPGDGGGDGWVF